MPALELPNVAVKVLDAELVIDTVVSTLQHRPERLHTATAERTEYQDHTATAEKTEYTDEKTEHRTQYPAENRDNSYLAANQHMVKFADELRGINEQAALSFDRRKNPAEYDLKEKQALRAPAFSSAT